MVFLIFFSLSKRLEMIQTVVMCWLPFLVWSFSCASKDVDTFRCSWPLCFVILYVGLVNSSNPRLESLLQGIRVDVVHGANLAYVCTWINVQSLNTTCTENQTFVNSCRLTEWFLYLLGCVYVCVLSCFSNVQPLDSCDRL